MKESLNEKEIIDKIWEEMRIDINTFAVPKSLLREYLDGLIKDYGYLNGKIPLCRDCHDCVEEVVAFGKIKKQWYQKGYNDALPQDGGQHGN